MKVQLKTPRKIYCIDNGLINAIAFKTSLDIGKLLENLVYIELKRRVGGEIYYYKTKEGYEIDFITKSGLEVNTLIQVSYALNNEETRKREIRSLEKGMNELKVKESYIITLSDEEDVELHGKLVHIVPASKWFLGFYNEKTM